MAARATQQRGSRMPTARCGCLNVANFSLWTGNRRAAGATRNRMPEHEYGHRRTIM
jgi:hypothetical protein